jgi:calcineurin-like phosphoesterase family protein
MLYLENKNIFVTSDTHYSHAGITKGTTHWRIDDGSGNKIVPIDVVRDFDTLEDMNETMIKNINETVKENDTLIHLGDWSFGGHENIKEFRDRVNCKNIHLMLGNHDHHIEGNKDGVRGFFKSVDSYLEIAIGSKNNNKKLILCHYPIVSWNHLKRGGYMLHGHQHLKGDKRFGNGKRMDVGMCGSPEFRPYHLDEIFALLKDRESYEVDNRMKDGVKLIR